MTEVDVELFDDLISAIAFVAERGVGVVWVPDLGIDAPVDGTKVTVRSRPVEDDGA